MMCISLYYRYFQYLFSGGPSQGWLIMSIDFGQMTAKYQSHSYNAALSHGVPCHMLNICRMFHEELTLESSAEP